MGKMMLAVVVVLVSSAFYIPHVQSGACTSICTNASCVTLDMILGHWYGAYSSEITELSSCYDLTHTPCGTGCFNFGGWYFVKPGFGNVTFNVPDMCPSKCPSLLSPDVYCSIGTVHPGTLVYLIAVPAGVDGPFILALEFLQGDGCGFLNVLAYVVLPNLALTYTHFVLVRDIQNKTAQAIGLEMMKTYNGNPQMRLVYDESCGF